MNEELRALYRSIHPAILQEYLRRGSWDFKEDSSAQTFALYERNGVAVDVPLHPEYADYARRVEEVIELVAQVDGIGVLTLMTSLNPSSILRVPVCLASRLRRRPWGRRARFQSRSNA